MAYNQGLADDLRARLGGRPGLSEREMFGGIAFMINGNMAVGVSGDDLMVRVGKDAHDEAVTKPGARDFDMSGRPMRGWILVSPEDSPQNVTWDAGLTKVSPLPRVSHPSSRKPEAVGAPGDSYCIAFPAEGWRVSRVWDGRRVPPLPRRCRRPRRRRFSSSAC